MNNSFYLRRRSKIIVPESSEANLPLSYAASVARNLETLAFTLSEPLIGACQNLPLDELKDLHQQHIAELRLANGAHQTFQLMCPNFVDSGLYLNAIVHYVSDGKWLPSPRKLRLPLLDNVNPQIIDLETQEGFGSLFPQIASFADTKDATQSNGASMRHVLKTHALSPPAAFGTRLASALAAGGIRP